jgi:hypothetical protein
MFEPLAEDAFWGTPLEAAPALLDELLDRDEHGLRLWAPTSVPLDTRSSLPIHVGVVGPIAELQRLALVERTIVVAVDVATGATSAVRTGGSGGPARLAPPPGFEGGLGAGSGARAARVVRFPLWAASSAWSPGRYRLTAIAGDRTSNDVLVDVVRSPSTADPAVWEARSASALQAWPPPDPAGGLPRYHAQDWSLPAPSGVGVLLHAERIVRPGPGATCALEGAVRARPLGPNGSVLPVTLVVTGTETPGPWIVPMRVPSFDRDAASRDAGLTAHFAVDLLRLAPLADAPQTYFVYAFLADGHTGAQPVAVVAT